MGLGQDAGSFAGSEFKRSRAKKERKGIKNNVFFMRKGWGRAC